MADQKISELTQVTNLETADEFAVVDGSVTKKVTYGDLVTDLESTMDVESASELNVRDTANRTRSNHTGTQAASTISDFDTEVSNNTDVAANTSARHSHSNKAVLDATTASFTTADETKLDGIETAATADQTGSEIVSAINTELGNTDWQTQVAALTQEQVEDYVAALFQAGSHTNITVTYDDVAGSISLSGSAGGGGSSLTQEEVEDFVGGVVAGGTGITVTYDDAGNELSISLSGESFTSALKTKLDGIATGATANDTDANLKNRANHTGTQAISTITNLQTELDGKQDTISANTAFNKNFGTTAGTVTEGNDSRLSDARTPVAHTHTASEITDFDTEVANNSAVAANTAKISFDSASSTKLAGIETSADVTDATNVAAAGAFMTGTNDSDDITEGSTNLFMSSAEQTKLSGIEALADVTDATNVKSAAVSETSVASSATPAPTGDKLINRLYITALAANATISAPSGTLANGNTLIIRIKDNGTSRTLAYNSVFRAVGVTLPTATTASKTIYLGCIYNSTDSKWDVTAVAEEA